MATQICNNDGNAAHVFGHKSKGGFYQSFFRGRKPACRTKPATAIPIKKRQPLPLPTIQQNKRRLESESELESCSERKEDDDSKRLSKRVCTPTAAAATAYSDYESLGIIGKGSYGVVYRVRHKQTGQIMAMKEETDGLSRTALTEIDILKTLPRHPSIVGFHGVAADEYGGSFLLMEYMHTDLRTYIALKKQNGEGFSMNHVKKMMNQLLEGVDFLHQNGVMHRDLKPENILVNSNGDLKICDFGMAARFVKEEKASYSPRVGSLWYRAHELLLDGVDEYEYSYSYSSEVDMWSVGCIMAELVLNKVLFRGKDEEDQLHEIYCVLGHPSNAGKINSSISSANSVLSEDGFDLLKGLLSYDTSKRITAESALSHVWFFED